MYVYMRVLSLSHIVLHCLLNYSKPQFRPWKRKDTRLHVYIIFSSQVNISRYCFHGYSDNENYGK